MSERTFTIFEGPDAGKSFVLGDTPVTLGREEGRDVMLHDDRASRLHARIVPDGDIAAVVDENSSNGTFVNGTLIAKYLLQAGDIIQIGANRIIYGREQPDEERMSLAASKARSYSQASLPGSRTEVLPSPDAALPVNLVETQLGEVLKAVADAVRPVGEPHGITVSVENDLKPDTVTVDPDRLHTALEGMVAKLLKTLTHEVGAGRPTKAHGMVVLRAAHDPAGGGFQIEVICVGLPLLAERIVAQVEEGAFREAGAVASAHEGVLELAPKDSKDILVRMRLPPGLSRTTQATVIES